MEQKKTVCSCSHKLYSTWYVYWYVGHKYEKFFLIILVRNYRAGVVYQMPDTASSEPNRTEQKNRTEHKRDAAACPRGTCPATDAAKLLVWLPSGKLTRSSGVPRQNPAKASSNAAWSETPALHDTSIDRILSHTLKKRDENNETHTDLKKS